MLQAEEAQVVPVEVEDDSVGLDQAFPTRVRARGQGAERGDHLGALIVVEATDDGDAGMKGQGCLIGRPLQLHEPHPSFIG